MTKLTCFKAYDIRGRLGEELNEDIAWRIGRAYGEYLKPKTIVLGGDVRLTSEALKLALAKGLQDAGVDVLDIGMSGTEEIYFATFHLGVDGGIEVTASHNPMDYNGMKLVREGARPISGDTGLRDVQRLAEAGDFPPVNEAARGSYRQISLRDAYIDHLLGYISVSNLTPLKLVFNAGNGAAGPVIDAIEARLKALGAPVEFIKIHNTPDGGRLGEELNEDIAWRIGRAYGEYLKPKTIVLGGDVRLTSEALKMALAKGLQDAGVDVLDIGMSGTEEIYFATFHLGVDGGIEVTASHNPMDYNGMKLVREGARPISGDTGLRDVQRQGARPISGDTGLRDVQRLAEAGNFPPVNEAARGSYRQISLRAEGAGRAGGVHQNPQHPGRHLPERHSQPVAAGVSRRHPQGRY